MSKLNQGELLDIFDGVFSFYLGELGHEEDKVKIEQAKKQIVALIQKPQVTEEWIEEKANILYEKISELNQTLPTYSFLEISKDFIRSLVEETQYR